MFWARIFPLCLFTSGRGKKKPIYMIWEKPRSKLLKIQFDIGHEPYLLFSLISVDSRLQTESTSNT